MFYTSYFCAAEKTLQSNDTKDSWRSLSSSLDGDDSIIRLADLTTVEFTFLPARAPILTRQRIFSGDLLKVGLDACTSTRRIGLVVVVAVLGLADFNAKALGLAIVLVAYIFQGGRQIIWSAGSKRITMKTVTVANLVAAKITVLSGDVASRKDSDEKEEREECNVNMMSDERHG